MNTLKISRRSPSVAQITMSRTSVFNAFDEEMISELEAAFVELGNDDGVRVILLAGEGKHFSAGADLQWMKRASAATQEWNLADARRFAGMLYRIQTCPKPTIARVQGAALGGGVGLACVCDVAVASDDASFAVSEAKFGILPAVIGPYVVNAVGKRQATRLALTASRLSAREALEIGLIHRVVELSALDDAIEAVIRDLIAAGPRAQQEIKNLYAQFDVGAVDEQVREMTAQTISRVRGTPEAQEGFSAFLDKRQPNWMSR